MPMSRDEHIAWAKKRALEYLDLPTPDIKGALNSMTSDMTKHPEAGMGYAMMMLGRSCAAVGPDKVREWIEGF